jgi:ribonuclease HI
MQSELETPSSGMGQVQFASKGNQGPAGQWSLFRDEHGQILGMSYKFLDVKSINQAEIEGMVLGNAEELRRRYKKVVYEGNSKLIVKHINWKISHPSWPMASKVTWTHQK